MTTNIFDPLAANLDRRQLLVRALFGSVGAATGLTALPSEAEASGHRRVVFDLAILGQTFTTILAPGATDSTNLRFDGCCRGRALSWRHDSQGSDQLGPRVRNADRPLVPAWLLHHPHGTARRRGPDGSGRHRAHRVRNRPNHARQRAPARPTHHVRPGLPDDPRMGLGRGGNRQVLRRTGTALRCQHRVQHHRGPEFCC